MLLRGVCILLYAFALCWAQQQQTSSTVAINCVEVPRTPEPEFPAACGDDTNGGLFRQEMNSTEILSTVNTAIGDVLSRLQNCERVAVQLRVRQQEQELSTQQKLDACNQELANEKDRHANEVEALHSVINELQTDACDSRVRKGHWVTAYNGTVPEGTVQSGLGPNKPYYLARTMVDGNMLPCKLTSPHNCCWAAWNNTEKAMKQYEALVDADVRWERMTSAVPIPPRALIVGNLTANGSTQLLFVGRAFIGNFLVPGYVYEQTRLLLHSSAFKNEIATSYEILVSI